jgi:hypothetical protein
MATDLLMEVLASVAYQVNVKVLDLLQASRFSDLFLSLMLSGSLSVAFTVLVIGCFLPAAKSSR